MRPTFRSEIVFVTPEQAALWLLVNNNGRKLNLAKARRIADDLLRGDWKPAHQGIAPFPDGSLADGQHRLTAIVMVGIGAWNIVTCDLPFEAIQQVDRNMPRPLAARLAKSVQDISVARLALAVLTGRHANLKEAFTTAEVQRVLPFTEPRRAELRAACPTIRRSRSSASVQLAVMCHTFAAENEEQQRCFSDSIGRS
jgi:hypothetical protein